MEDDVRILSEQVKRLESELANDRQRRRLRNRLLLAALVAVPMVTNALPAVPYVFSAGEVVSATKMNDNFAHLVDGVSLVQTNHGALQDTVDQLDADVVPAGALVFFATSVCPTGWSPFSAAAGRALVGMPSGGQIAGTSGTPLTDVESRTHTHEVDRNGFTGTATYDGQHDHQWLADAGFAWQDGGSLQQTAPKIYVDETGVSTGTRVLQLFNSGSYHTYRDGGHLHDVNVSVLQPTTSETSGTLPYMQLQLCQKDT